MFVSALRRKCSTIALAGAVGLSLLGLCGCQAFPLGNAAAKKQKPNLGPNLPQLESDALSKTDEAPKSTLTKKQKAGMQLYVASSYEKDNDPQRAIQLYKEVIQKDPKCAEAHHRLAILHDKAGKHDESFKYFREANRLEPENPDFYCDLGYSLYLQRRWQESERELRRAIALTANHTRSHNNLGLLLARTERYDEALHEFSQVGCTEAEARANLAHAMMMENRWADAQVQCDRALASKSASPEVTARLTRLRATISRVQASSQPASKPRATTASRAS